MKTDAKQVSSQVRSYLRSLPVGSRKILKELRGAIRAAIARRAELRASTELPKLSVE
jgi:hypothetical protein